MLLLTPQGADGSPVVMRMAAVTRHFGGCETLAPDASMAEKIRAARKHGTAIVTMPPFSNFWLLAVPGVSLIVDWRDGWSIAMVGGYGGTAKRKPARAALAKVIEIASIVMAREVWTCTPGLVRHHSKGLPGFLRRKIRLVPNGHQMEVRAARFKHFDAGDRLTAVCAGKFATYGMEKALRILDILGERYPGKAIDIRVIGAPKEDGSAIHEHIRARGLNITISWERRKSYHEVVKDIADADLALAVLRDESYEFGTKIFDCVATGTPIVDVFTDRAFRSYFSGCFDTDYDPEIARHKAEAFHRREQIAWAWDRAKPHPAFRRPSAEAATATA